MDSVALCAIFGVVIILCLQPQGSIGQKGEGGSEGGLSFGCVTTFSCAVVDDLHVSVKNAGRSTSIVRTYKHRSSRSLSKSLELAHEIGHDSVSLSRNCTEQWSQERRYSVDHQETMACMRLKQASGSKIGGHNIEEPTSSGRLRSSSIP